MIYYDKAFFVFLVYVLFLKKLLRTNSITMEAQKITTKVYKLFLITCSTCIISQMDNIASVAKNKTATTRKPAEIFFKLFIIIIVLFPYSKPAP